MEENENNVNKVSEKILWKINKEIEDMTSCYKEQRKICSETIKNLAIAYRNLF